MHENFRHDVVIALGKSWKNVVPRPQSPELSFESQITTKAAGKMYDLGWTPHIIFTTGRTTQFDIDEAGEMKKCLDRSRYWVPQTAVTLESNSWCTRSNALETYKVVNELGFKKPALITVYPHTIRAQIIFNNNGFNIPTSAVFDSYWILKDDFRFTIDKYKKSLRYKKEFVKEMICLALTKTIDPKGEFLSRIAERTRHRK